MFIDKLRILIADDEALIRMDLREMLQEKGHVVIEARNGREALLFAREKHPDLAIFDVRMPDMDGIAAARALRREHLAPVLLLTAFSQGETIERAVKAGVYGYLVKPVREEELFAAIKVALSRHHAEGEMAAELLLLKGKLEGRKAIDRAKGILMTVHHFTEDEAYRRLRCYSMEKNTTMEKVAAAVIQAAELRADNK